MLPYETERSAVNTIGLKERSDRLPEPLLRILNQRGLVTDQEIKRFLYPDLSDLHDPYGMKDMESAVARIVSAVTQGEKILVYGDYDCDGVTSTALVKRYLDSKGAVTDYYIPNRLLEGYGLNREVIKALPDQNVALIVTVDTGSTAVEEVAYATGLGIDTVITDHHECREEIPLCAAVVNPMRPDCSYPFKGLAGVGVAFKLICALEARFSGDGGEQIADRLLSLYGDLVALGTIADVMPMLDENRYIVKRGLALAQKGGNIGLASLKEKLGMGEKEITSSFFGFSLAPHVNAAGRMGHAEDALKLLLCNKITEAGAIASLLCEYNRLRKREEELIFKEAQEQILQEGYDNDAVLVLAKEGWHHGVLGIVAAKITEKYGRPSFLLSFEGEEGRGSCRSVQGVDLVALLTAVKEHTVKFGGHEMAAGLTVTREELPRLRKALLSAFEENFKIESADEKQEQADAVLSAYDLTLPFAEALSLLEPFGEGNPTPRFLLENVQIEGVTPLSMGKHTKLLLEKDGLLFTALLFSKKTALFPYIEGDTASVVFELSVNEYMKKKSVQLLVRQIFPMGVAADAFLEGKEAYLHLTERKPCAVTFPERTDFARVYTLLRAMKQSGEESFSLRILSLKAGCASLAQCMLILLVFKEQGLIALSEEGQGCFAFRLLSVDKKADLEKSALLNSIKRL